MPADETGSRDDKLRRRADDALRRLSADLEAGRSETLVAYLAAMSRFHRYSWNNVLLISAQRPTATRVAGYQRWRELGRWVRSGEKGIMIAAPRLIKPTKPEQLTAPAKVPDEDRPEVSGFRAAYVFDLAQTEGRPLPAFAATTGDPKDYAERLKAFVVGQGIAFKYSQAIAPAQGTSSGGRITLVPGLSPAEEFSVLTHELAHELLHRGEDRGTIPKVVRETQAEAVGFVVSRGVGLETQTAAQDYIALYGGSAKTLGESLAAVRETSTRILNHLLPDERTAPERTAGERATSSPEQASPTSEPGRTPAVENHIPSTLALGPLTTSSP